MKPRGDIVLITGRTILSTLGILAVAGALAALAVIYSLWWAVGYNAIAFPLAAGVFYPFVLSPEVAALSMTGSTLVAAFNALMLKRTK